MESYFLSRKLPLSAMMEMNRDLLKEGHFTDVTLVSNDMKLYAAHRTILSSASSVFKELLMLQPHHKDPMLFMKDVSQADLKCLLEFVYLGETEISEDRIESFLKLGKEFNIKDLNSSPNTDDVKKESTEVQDVKENRENYQMKENSKPNYDVPIKTSNFEEMIKTSNQKSHSKGDLKPENNNICPECDKVFASKGNMVEHHKAAHAGIRYSCDICEYKATRKNVLRRHKSNVHGIES